MFFPLLKQTYYITNALFSEFLAENFDFFFVFESEKRMFLASLGENYMAFNSLKIDHKAI